MGFENISEAGGIGLALTGMTIVFAALILVTLFIAGLPRFLPFANRILPVAEARHGAPLSAAAARGDVGTGDEIVAAIGFALHVHRSE